MPPVIPLPIGRGEIDARADARIAVQKGVANNGLATLRVGNKPGFVSTIIPMGMENPAVNTRHMYIIEESVSGGNALMYLMMPTNGIRAIYSAYSGTLRKAWHSDTATVIAGSDARSTSSPWYRFLLNGDASEYVGWLVPSAANGSTEIVVNYLYNSAYGTCNVQIQYGGTGDWITVGTVDCGVMSTDIAQGASSWDQTKFIQLSTPVTTGDNIRVINTEAGTSASIQNIILVHPTDAPTVSSGCYLLPSTIEQVIFPGSAQELAYEVQPSGGSGYKWFGGWTHWGGTDCTPVSITETIISALTGTAWTPVRGCYNYGLYCFLDCTVRYDATPTDLCTLRMEYSFLQSCFTARFFLTWLQDVDVGAGYSAMMVMPATMDSFQVDNAIYDMTDAVEGASTIYIPPRQVISTINDRAFAMSPLSLSFISAFVKYADSKKKVYWNNAIYTSVLSGTVDSGGFSMQML